MSRYSKTERVGVNAVERIVVDELEWIFREQPIVDMGIDAHMERVDERVPTGRLVALQIKTGPSHFIEKKAELIFYGKLAHLDYWTGHSLPVILVAHLPAQNCTCWTTVTEANVQRTKRHWKIAIPKANVFGPKTQKALASVFDGSPTQQRLRRLSIHEPLMRHIQNGGRVSVGLEDWVNKSLGRTPVKVYIHDEDGTESLSQDWFQYYTGFGMKELAERLFPWARASVDREFYDEHDEIDRSDDFSGPDDEGAIPPDNDSVYPYAEGGGEVEYYRLRLDLNDLGDAFLKVSDHVSAND